MKKLLVLLFSLLISFNSYGEWTKISENTLGDTYYIDSDSIKERGGYFYYWELDNYKKELDSAGSMSAKLYIQVDCELFRYKTLTYIFYKQQMGNGEIIENNNPTNPIWRNSPPGSVATIFLDLVCD